MVELKTNSVRFSPIKYGTHMEKGASVQRLSKQKYTEIIEDVRRYLVTLKGIETTERDSMTHLLNRAVLGYQEDRQAVYTLVHEYLLRQGLSNELAPDISYCSLSDAVFAEVVGLQVLEPLLKDRDGLEEIQVNGTRIYEVRGGCPVLSRFEFDSVQDVIRIQQNLVMYNKDSFTPRKRWAEVMLPDGARVTLTGFGFTSQPTITIRFYVSQRLSLQELSGPQFETMDETTELLLTCFVQGAMNLVIIGPTNSGKTCLMKALIGLIPDEERLITLESRLELALLRDYPKKNIIEYEIDEWDKIHDGEQAFKLALRQSPKRIIHAEIRDEDANLYVRACTRGHQGSMTTLHVGALEDVPDAIADMCMMDGRALNQQRLIKRIVEHVAQIGIELRLIRGKRRIVRICEFCWENGEHQAHDLIVYDSKEQQWQVMGTLSDRAKLLLLQMAGPSYTQLQERGLLS